MSGSVEKDERTVAVEKAGHSIAYIFMSFALLFDVAFRSFRLKQSSFDLLAIVVLSGVITALYQAKHQTLNRGWVKSVIVAIAAAVFIGILITTLK